MSETRECAPEAGAPKDVVDCDSEVWVQKQIFTAMRMALALKRERAVCADDDAFEGGLEGVANGVAVEIIRTLGKEPGFVNLRKVPRVSTRYDGPQMSELAGLRP